MVSPRKMSRPGVCGSKLHGPVYAPKDEPSPFWDDRVTIRGPGAL